jgi:hypothetical protein
VRALIRFRWLLPVFVIPVCIALLGLGMQAAVFPRPPAESLLTADMLRKLLGYREMRATENIGGRRVSAVCVQGRFTGAAGRPEFGALVLLGNGERLYDFGHGVREVGRRGSSDRADQVRFLLAGCPNVLADRISTRLREASIETDAASVDGGAAVAIRFGHRHSPIVLYVDAHVYKPVELTLSGRDGRGWSDLAPGGTFATIVRVRRAFENQHALRHLHA